MPAEQPALTAGTAAARGTLEEDEEQLGPRTLHDNHHWQCIRWVGDWVPPKSNEADDDFWQPQEEREAQVGADADGSRGEAEPSIA